MRDRLSTVNYYRLTGYWHPFRLPNSDHFRPGTTFERVWERYVFDRKLRLVVMDAIERIEVATRTQISYHHGLAYGPFGYAENASSLPAFSQNEYAEFRRRVDEDVGRAREVFVDHFRQKYGDTHGSLPIWVASEVLSFGLVIRMVRNAPNAVTKPVAAAFGVSRNVLESWLLTTNTVRNILRAPRAPLEPRAWYATQATAGLEAQCAAARISAPLPRPRHLQSLAREGLAGEWLGGAPSRVARRVPRFPTGEHGFSDRVAHRSPVGEHQAGPLTAGRTACGARSGAAPGSVQTGGASPSA
jgi:hypothetical protein